MNWRVADLTERQREMLKFSIRVTENSADISQSDRDALTHQGFSDEDIFDIAAVAAFFNMSNRHASAIGMMPNAEYHAMARG